MRSSLLLAASLFLLSGRCLALDIDLPTTNHHLLTGEPEQFYQYVDRTFEGQVSKEWQAGGYGFVRNPVRFGDQVVMTKFHEGIDIAPMGRDPGGNPQDPVKSIADGTVAYTSPIPGRSNYGRYVVVEHHFDDGAFYSVYAHLSEITVKVGDAVKKGGVVAKMGFTGAGITKVRAHCHLELCLLDNANYDAWNKAAGGGVNYHGNFNGMNLSGLDVARLFLERQANPEIKVQDFVRDTPAYFKVTLPRKGKFEFAERNHWLVDGDMNAPSPSWEITFTATGLPVRIAPSEKEVPGPLVTSVRDSKIPHRYLTRGLIDGTGSAATLTKGGKSLVSLLTEDEPAAATAAPEEAEEK
jgi:CxxC motif-containing protein